MLERRLFPSKIERVNNFLGDLSLYWIDNSDSSYSSSSDDNTSSDNNTSESNQQNKEEIFSITSEKGIKVKNSQNESEVIQMKKDPDPSAYAPLDKSPTKLKKNGRKTRKGKKIIKKKSTTKDKLNQKQQKESSSSTSSTSEQESDSSSVNNKNNSYTNPNSKLNNDNESDDDENDTNLISGSFKVIDNSSSEVDTRSPVFMKQDIYSPLFQKI